MKIILLCLLFCGTTIHSTNAAYESFRVVELAPVQFPVQELQDGEVVNQYFGTGESLSLSFTCNPGQRYIVWATEDLDQQKWFPIKEVAPDQDEISQQNGEDIATVMLPKPFMSHFTSGRGFVRVSIAQEDPPISNNDWVSIRGLVNYGDYIALTFKSESLQEYLIEAADSPVATNWIPVDLYGYENSADRIKIQSQGTITTVYISNPMLPWIPVDGGWIRIRRISSSGVLSQSVLSEGPVTTSSTAPEKLWYLVCTRAGYKDGWRKSTNIGGFLNDGVMEIRLEGHASAFLGQVKKYHVVDAAGFADANVNELYVGWRQGWCVLPPQPGPITFPMDARIKTMVALSRYVGGAEPPSVIYMPQVNPYDTSDGHLQFHLEIRNSTIVAVATWDQPSPLKDGISLEPAGVGFTVRVGGKYSLSFQNCYQFNAMDVDMYDAYSRMLFEQNK